MSFLRRLLGGERSAQVEMNVNYFKRIRDDATLDVVGEAYRQSGVLAARPPTGEDLPPGLPAPPPGYFKALLVPEPTNQYDRNAIKVVLWAGRSWSMAGYLSRFDAIRYQPLFAHLATSASGTQPAIACDAALTNERSGTGVVLHLGTPGECAAELATDDVAPAEHRWVGKYIVFTGQGGSTIFGVPLDREGQVMLARWAGCEVLPRLTKKTDALIVSDNEQTTANRQKATEYNLATIEETTFLAEIGIDTAALGRVTGRWARG
jgi:hypothetical protein